MRRTWTPALSLVAIGGIVLAAEAADGDVASGLGWFAALAILGAILAFGARYEAVRTARGEGGDERDELIETRAMAFAGTVLVTALTGAVLAALLQGDDPSPYTWILAAGGVAFVGAWAWLWR